MAGPDPSDSLPAMRRRPTLAVILAGVGVLAACSSGSSSPDPTGGSALATQVLATTKTTVDKATSLHLTLAGTDLPAARALERELAADGERADRKDGNALPPQAPPSLIFLRQNQYRRKKKDLQSSHLNQENE